MIAYGMMNEHFVNTNSAVIYPITEIMYVAIDSALRSKVKVYKLVKC